MIEMKASDYEKAIDEAPSGNYDVCEWVKRRAREIAAARQASEPARGEVSGPDCSKGNHIYGPGDVCVFCKGTRMHNLQSLFEAYTRVCADRDRLAAELAEAKREWTWKKFYDEVCRRAENNMLRTGKLEGMHYAAMKELRAELESIDDAAARNKP